MGVAQVWAAGESGSQGAKPSEKQPSPIAWPIAVVIFGCGVLAVSFSLFTRWVERGVGRA